MLCTKAQLSVVADRTVSVRPWRYKRVIVDSSVAGIVKGHQREVGDEHRRYTAPRTAARLTGQGKLAGVAVVGELQGQLDECIWRHLARLDEALAKSIMAKDLQVNVINLSRGSCDVYVCVHET